MKRSRVWLLVTALLFAVWIGYLGYRVLTLRQAAAEGGGQPIVLSRPQFLVATLVVAAEVEGKEKQSLVAKVKVKEVYWPENDETRELVGQTIEVNELAECQGLSGAGTYLLPLLGGPKVYRVAPTPPSPGYPPQLDRPSPPRIYPSVPSTREQLELIRRKFYAP